MDNLNKLEDLVKKILDDANKCYEKGVFSRGREARNGLSQLAKLCKEVRVDVLNHMNKIKEDKKN